MNKEDAQKQIVELRAKLAELEANIAAEDAINSKDLVGKLCYVWDKEFSDDIVRVIVGISSNTQYPYVVGIQNAYAHAKPVPESKAMNFIYKPTKSGCRAKPGWREWYSQYIFPNEAKYIYTDVNGNVFWSSLRAKKSILNGIWVFEDPNVSYSDWGWISRNNPPCPDWANSEVEI